MYRVLPTVLVSDRVEWLEQAGQLCRFTHTVPECESWSSLRSRSGRVAVLVLDVRKPLKPKRGLLREWASTGLQPVCVVCIAPERGAVDLSAWLRSLGYRCVLYGASPREYRHDLQSHLQRIIERRVWIVPEVAAALECFEPAVLEALAIGMMLIPEHTTVEYWARELGLGRRQQLEELFARQGFPSPKKTFEWLRLARVVEYAEGLEGRISRGDLARAFGYPSGRYLGRRARELSGQPLGRLLTGGVDGLCQLVRERCKSSCGPPESVFPN